MKIKININNQIIEYDNVSCYELKAVYSEVSFEIERYIDISEERSICTTINFHVNITEFRGIEIC